MKKILVVDDDKIVRTVISNLIEDNIKNTAVINCGSVQNAFDLIYENKFDVLVTDIRMRDGFGTDLVKTLRTHSDFESLPVLIISSVESTKELDDELVKEFKRIGSLTQFMKKPLNNKLFINSIKYYLNLKNEEWGIE